MPAAVELLRDLAARYPSGPLFRNRIGRPWKRPAIGFGMRRTRKAAGLPGKIAYGYRHGFALTRINREANRLIGNDWPTRPSLEADDVADGELIGIVCGPPSAPEGFSLECVDCDSAEAVAIADDYLPHTGMVHGLRVEPARRASEA